MKEQADFDTWLRQSLDGYKPSPAPASRERFLNRATASSGSGSLHTFFIIGISLLMIISAVCIYIISAEQPSALTYYPAITMANAEVGYEDYRKVKLTKEEKIESTKTSFTASSIVTGRNEQNAPSGKSAEINTYESLQKTLADEIQGNLTIDTTINNDQVTINDLPLPVLIQQDADSSGIDLEISSKSRKQEDFEPYSMNRIILLYYRPEYLWNIIENEKLVHNFGMEWQRKLFNGRYTIGTGLGLSVNKGYYEYAVDYNEYLGNYQQLDSITFNWNPEEFEMQYDVHTSEETVYDTAVKTSYERVYRRFIYLQLPLTMGYDFIKTGKSSLGIRFVPVLSLLLSKKPFDFRYDAGNNRIIQINRITADRVNSNWQLNSGLVYSRQLNKSLRLEIEPRFTYYFNSVFEKSDNSVSPMGASIRVALGIRY